MSARSFPGAVIDEPFRTVKLNTQRVGAQSLSLCGLPTVGGATHLPVGNASIGEDSDEVEEEERFR